MDASAQSKPNILIRNSNFKLGSIIIPLLTLLVGVVLGYSSNRLLPSQPLPSKTRQLTERSIVASLPVALPILQNPMVDSWRGEVKGTLIAKGPTSITLSDGKDHTIIIPIVTGPKGTKFLSRSQIKQGILNKSMSLDDIAIGKQLLGDFFVMGAKDQIVGSSFIVEE